MPFLIWYRKMNFFHDIVIEKTSRVCHDWRWKEYTNREQLHMGTCLKSVALTVPPSLIGISYLFPVRLSTTVRESRFFSADAKVWNRSKVPWGETVESWRWAASTANLLRWGDEEDNDDNDDDDEEEEEEEEDEHDDNDDEGLGFVKVSLCYSQTVEVSRQSGSFTCFFPSVEAF